MDGKNFRRGGNENKPLGRSGIAEFLDRQGIYIVMLVCLALIGVTAYFAFSGDQSAQLPEETAEQAGVNQGSTLDDEIGRIVATPEPTVTPTATPKASPTATPSSTPKSTATAVKMTWPCDGTVLREYSPTKPVYFATINAWMVHNGVDIKAAEGTEVKAAYEGKVESLSNEQDTGYTVVVSCSGGIKTIYGNLKALDCVTKGQTVKQGDKIGVVGQSATQTSGDPCHVHFAVTLNGKYVDPADYISDKLKTE